MTTSDVNAILQRLAALEATVVAKFDALGSDNKRGDEIHDDHSKRIRALEDLATEGRGVWKLLTAGGVVGAVIVGIAVAIARSLGA